MKFEIIPAETILSLLELARQHDLDELSLSTPDGKFSVRLGSPAPAPALEPAVPAAVERVESRTDLESGNLLRVISPLMGVFYRAPAPGASPFVEVGDLVKPGDTLCVVEAMKVMNEITSEVSGAVERVFPKNGDVVEEGAVLFLIRPEGAP